MTPENRKRYLWFMVAFAVISFIFAALGALWQKERCRAEIAQVEASIGQQLHERDSLVAVYQISRELLISQLDSLNKINAKRIIVKKKLEEKLKEPLPQNKDDLEQSIQKLLKEIREKETWD